MDFQYKDAEMDELSEGILGQRKLYVKNVNLSEFFDFMPLSSHRIRKREENRSMSIQRGQSMYGLPILEIQRFALYQMLKQREQNLLKQQQLTKEKWDRATDWEKYNQIQKESQLYEQFFQFLSVQFQKKFYELQGWRMMAQMEYDINKIPYSNSALLAHNLQFSEIIRTGRLKKTTRLFAFANFDTIFQGKIIQKDPDVSPFIYQKDLLVQNFKNGLQEILLDGVEIFQNLNALVEGSSSNGVQLYLYSKQSTSSFFDRYQQLNSSLKQADLNFPQVRAVAIFDALQFANITSESPLLYRETFADASPSSLSLQQPPASQDGGLWIIGCGTGKDAYRELRKSLVEACLLGRGEAEDFCAVIDIEEAAQLNQEGFVMVYQVNSSLVLSNMEQDFKGKKIPLSSQQLQVPKSNYRLFQELKEEIKTQHSISQNDWNDRQMRGKVSEIEFAAGNEEELITKECSLQFDKLIQLWRSERSNQGRSPRYGVHPDLANTWRGSPSLQVKMLKDLKSDSVTNKFIFIEVDNLLEGTVVQKPLNTTDILVSQVNSFEIRVILDGFKVMEQLDSLISRFGYTVGLLSTLREQEQLRLLEVIKLACEQRCIKFPRFSGTVVFDPDRFSRIKGENSLIYHNTQFDIWMAGFGIETKKSGLIYVLKQLFNIKNNNDGKQTLQLILAEEAVVNTVRNANVQKNHPQKVEEEKEKSFSTQQNQSSTPRNMESTSRSNPLGEAVAKIYQQNTAKQIKNRIVGYGQEEGELLKFTKEKGNQIIISSPNPVGKSELTKKVALNFENQIIIDLSQFPEPIFSVQLAMKTHLGIAISSDRDNYEIINDFYSNCPPNTCIVYDGLNNEDQIKFLFKNSSIKKLFEKGCGLIGASRNETFIVPCLKLKGFNEFQALQYFKKALPKFQQSDQGYAVNQFKGIPLFLTLASVYMQKKRKTAAQLWNDIQKILSNQYQFQKITSDEKSLLGLVKLIFDELKQAKIYQFHDLIVAISYLYSKGITAGILESIADAQIEKQIVILVEFGLIHWEGTVLICNETIQRLLRILIKSDSQQFWDAINRLLQFLEVFVEQKDPRFKVNKIPHFFNFINDPQIFINRKYQLYSFVASFFCTEGNNPQLSLPFCEEALSFKEIDQHTQITLLGYQASALSALKQFDQQVVALNELLTLKIAEVGQNHFSLEPTYNNIGSAQAMLQNYRESKENYLQGIHLAENNSSIDQKSMASTYLNLALVLKCLRDRDGAISYGEKAYQIFLETRGEGNSQTQAAKELAEGNFKT